MDKSGDKKLAKSSGEFLSLDAIRKRGYDPIVYRYLILLGHFQSQIAFSWEALDAAANGYKNIVKKIATIIPTAIGGGCDEVAGGGWHDKILSAVNDNLKTATAIVEFQNMLADADTDPATKIAIVKFVDELLGLEFMAHAENMIDKTIRKNIPNEVQNLVDRRVEAKANKNWELADELRDKLAKLGWIVEDTPTGSRLISLV
jgi:cysteinyl-tRNA synthetase